MTSAEQGADSENFSHGGGGISGRDGGTQIQRGIEQMNVMRVEFGEQYIERRRSIA